MSRISKSDKMKKPMQPTGQALTPAAVLRNENEVIDLYSEDDLGDDALELLIKSKQEAEVFNDLPLFDVGIRVKMCKRMDQRPPWHRHIDIDVALSFSLFLNPSSHQRSSSPSRGISWTTEQSQWAKNPPMVSDISITSSSFVTSHSDPGDLEVSTCCIYSHCYFSCRILLFVELISNIDVK